MLGGTPLRCFVPLPLPPAPEVDLTGARGRLFEKAVLALGRLDSISVLLPDPQLFLYGYVRREAVLSSQIEGTQSSLSDLLLFEVDEVPGAPLDDVIEVSNYVAALSHGIRRLGEGLPLCNRLIREVHAQLLRRGRGSEKSPGQFRRVQNWIGGNRPEAAHFVPPPPQQVEECMAALEQFIHSENSELPMLVRAAVAHVQFETIHPFLDGNGRVGRLLIALMLHDSGMLAQPLLYLSLYFRRHRATYYELLDQVRHEGDWEVWVDFFLDGVVVTAENAVTTAQRLSSLFATDQARIQGLNRVAGSVLRVFVTMREHPVMSLNELCHRTGITFPTASKAVNTLMGLGIVRELTGRRRKRVYIYDRYLALLNEGTEVGG
jgi:Fic family protein